VPEQPVATRRTTWPLGADSDRQHWDEWSRLVQAARHPSLARVNEVRRDQHEGSLVVADRGSESVTGWIERTGASVPERLAVLRAAAAAVDALHAGTPDSPGLAHGGLTAESVRVDPDGAARVVGFSPWAGTADGQQRFLAPELTAGAPATRAGDVYAFAWLVAEVLGGPAVVEAQDAGGVVRALRVSPDTRRRTRLVKAVHTALTSPPDARPQPLTAWLTAAVEGTAVTEVGAAGATAEPERAPSPDDTRRSLAWPVAVVIVAVLAAGIGAWAWKGRAGAAPSGMLTGPSSSPPASGITKPFTMTAHWEPACGKDTGIAAASTLEDLHRPTTADILDREPAGTAVGRWHTGRLLVSLSAPDGEQVTITGIDVNRVATSPPPAWIALVKTCSGTQAVTPDLRYDVDLDKRTVELAGRGSPRRFTPDGSFNLNPSPTVVAIDATACDAGYAWQPVIHYFTGDKTGAVIGPETYFTYGQPGSATVYDLGPGKTTPIVTLDPPPASPGCGRPD